MMMKQKLVAGAIALSAMAGLSVPAAQAEVSASVGIANMYYWRGLDLGNGDPALIGDVNVSSNGFYTGLWASSGDAAAGTEWDFYAGYGFDIGAFSVDLNYTTYMYPATEAGFDDISDVGVTLGFAASEDLSFGLMHRIGVGDALADDDYTYTTFTVSYDKFGFLYGVHSDESGAFDKLAHVDLSYAFTDKLTFTLGKVVDEGEAGHNDELKFVVNLSLPIK